MKVARETIELIAGSGVTALLTIAYVIYAGRQLGPAEYADFAAALSLIAFLTLVQSPLTPAIARLTARYQTRGDQDAVARLRLGVLRRVAALGAALTVAAVVASPWLAGALQFRSTLPLILAFVAVFIHSVVNVDRSVAHGLYRFRLYNVNTVIEAVVRLGAAMLAFAVARAAWIAVACYALGLLFAAFLIVFWLPRPGEHSREENRVDWEELKRLTLPMGGVMLSVAIFQNADMLAVKRWLDPSAAGIYGAATTFSRSFGVVVVPFYVIAGPLLTSLHETRRPIFRTTLLLAGGFLAVAMVPLTVLILWAEPLVRVLYGSEFAAAAKLIVPLGGTWLITYTGLMLAQALVTLHDFRFVRPYLAVAVLQIVALAAFHSSYVNVLWALYVCQAVAFVLVALYFLDARRRFEY